MVAIIRLKKPVVVGTRDVALEVVKSGYLLKIESTVFCIICGVGEKEREKDGCKDSGLRNFPILRWGSYRRSQLELKKTRSSGLNMFTVRCLLHA